MALKTYKLKLDTATTSVSLPAVVAAGKTERVEASQISVAGTSAIGIKLTFNDSSGTDYDLTPSLLLDPGHFYEPMFRGIALEAGDNLTLAYESPGSTPTVVLIVTVDET